MPSVRLLISFVLVAAVAACAGNDDSNGNPPGGGGAGGTGGTGGTVPGPDCGAGIRILEFDAAAGVLEGSLDNADNWAGSCAPAGSNGNDVVVHYTAAEAGYYRFSTPGSSFDTLLHALRDCTDGFTEAACNDDTNGTKQSQILVELQAGEELFVVVDSVGVRQATPFTLRAEKTQPQAPVIEESEGFANVAPEVSSTAFRVTGRNPDGGLVGFEMQFFQANGQPFFQQTIAADIKDVEAMFGQVGWGFMNVTEADGTFTVEAAFSVVDVPAAPVIEIAFIDENDFVSDVARITTAAPPVLARGDSCDLRRAFDECPAADACAVRAPATEPFCVIATAPTIGEASAFVNLDEDRFGIVVTGSDPESDVLYASVLPRDADGGALGVGGKGRTLLPYHQLGHDESGNFRGVVSFPAIFVGPCLDPAQDAYDTCLAGCTTQSCADACLNSANAQLRRCYTETLPLVASIEVELVDATGRVSGMVVANVTPAPEVAENGVCDPFGAIGICPAEMICWSADAYEAETCHAEGPVCPDDYGVIDLMSHAADNAWVYRGDITSGTVYGAATCGGGGPSEIFSFTAPSTGTWSIGTGSLASGVDTIVSLRTYCQLPAYEIACNDNPPLSGPHSRLLASLAEGMTVYIVVDSSDGSSGGPYTLTVSKL